MAILISLSRSYSTFPLVFNFSALLMNKVTKMADCVYSKEPSANLTNKSSNNVEEEENNFDFFLLIAKENHKTKIKWLGDLESLKSFVERKLKLEGSWSYASTHGGYHVFKASIATLCFYPGTKTLAVQGAKHEAIRKSICAFHSMEMNEKHQTTCSMKTHRTAILR